MMMMMMMMMMMLLLLLFLSVDSDFVHFVRFVYSSFSRLRKLLIWNSNTLKAVALSQTKDFSGLGEPTKAYC